MKNLTWQNPEQLFVAQELINKVKSKCCGIKVKSEYRIIRIDFDSIDYIESCDDYVKVYCNNRDKPILSLCSLKKLETVLPASDFIRVHRSYIVRKQSIKVIENRSIVFNKTRIPVSKASLKVLQDAIRICQ